MEQQPEKTIKESEIEEYGRMLEERRRKTEEGGIDAKHEDKEALGEIVREQMGGEEGFKSPPPASGIPEELPLEQRDEIAEIKSLPEDRRLHALIDVAFSKGVLKSIDLVRRMGDPYLVDAFHDAIVDALYEELVKRGKISPED